MGGYLEQNISHSSSSMNIEDWHNRYKQQVQWTQHIREYLLERVNTDQENKVLEIGSGTGALLEALFLSNQYQLTGVDISYPHLQFSKNILPKAFLVQADGYKLPYRKDTFIITICHYLLLWTESPEQILSEMQRVTKPGGCVIALAEPDHNARIDYPPPLDRLGGFQTAALEQQGVDVTIGRKLTGLFSTSGLSNVVTGVLGAQWEANPQKQLDTIEWDTLASDLGDKLSAESLIQYKKIENQAIDSGKRVLFVPTFYAAGFVE